MRLRPCINMLGNTALLTLPPLEFLYNEEQQHLRWTKDRHQLFLYNCFVSGLRHDNGPSLVPRVDKLDLVRECENKHDAFAVTVYWVGQSSGFLSMKENIMLANLIDPYNSKSLD